MPELPEVETTRRQLVPLLVGRRIVGVRATRASYFFLTPPRRLARGLTGRRVDELRRVGKYLVAHLDDGARVLMHLGMTGQIGALAWDQHTHLGLSFEDGRPEIAFRDVRRFGKVQLLEPGARSARLDRLGPDALLASGPALFTATRGRRAAIKSLLLDQSVLAGVGNIYADEALFLARIRPTRPAGRLTREAWERLAAAIRRVLEGGIQAGGSTISDFLSPYGEEGRYQDDHQVYGREGEACPRCRARIRRIVLGQRSSHYCPRCQR
jgi:formamidopyrimidine-DNA glycosylase